MMSDFGRYLLAVLATVAFLATAKNAGGLSWRGQPQIAIAAATGRIARLPARRPPRSSGGSRPSAHGGWIRSAPCCSSGSLSTAA